MKTLFERARQRIPGGVNSPVRAFYAVKSKPIFISQGKGSKLYSTDGKKYIDYLMSFGPLILGHNHPEVIAALKEEIDLGLGFGACTPNEVYFAEMLSEAMPSLEMVRLCNSGTEATMSAIRLARAFTKKKLIIKIEGCYHGHADFLLVKAGSGAMTYGIPSSKGVPKEITKLTLTIPYNNIEALDTTIQQFKQEIACIIIEPVAGNMGVVLPEPGFLQYIREETKKHEILLIFDEVITGFRLAYGGAAERYKIDPDLICLGKIIGGGLPIGAFGGRKDIMQLLAPEGPVYQAGTLSGNPLSVKAGIKTLEILKRELPYPELEQKTERLKQGLVQAAKKRGVSVHINQIASMLTLFFTSKKVFDYKTALSADTNKFSQFHKAMLNQGIYLPPSQFEAWFLSLAHTTDDIEETISCADRAFKDIL